MCAVFISPLRPRAKWMRETDSDLSRKKMLNDRRYSRNEECKSVTKALDIAADVSTLDY